MEMFTIRDNGERELGEWGKNSPAPPALTYQSSYCGICGTENQSCTGEENRGKEPSIADLVQFDAVREVARAFREADAGDERVDEGKQYGDEPEPNDNGWRDTGGFIPFG